MAFRTVCNIPNKTHDLGNDLGIDLDIDLSIILFTTLSVADLPMTIYADLLQDVSHELSYFTMFLFNCHCLYPCIVICVFTVELSVLHTCLSQSLWKHNGLFTLVNY